MQSMLGQSLNRLCQIVWCELSERDVDSREVLAIESVELRIVRGAVLRTVPPAPVAAFCCEERFFCRGERLCRRCAVFSLFVRRFRARVGFARVPKQFPRRYVLAAANPHVKICINP